MHEEFNPPLNEDCMLSPVLLNFSEQYIIKAMISSEKYFFFSFRINKAFNGKIFHCHFCLVVLFWGLNFNQKGL
jgi:hypothetical protein